MSFTLTYKILFEVSILHHYFLNKGHAVFDTLSTAEKKQVLKHYDVQDFISIRPTAACRDALQKNRLICKTTPSGFMVGVQAKPRLSNFESSVPLGDDLRFTFLVRFVDPSFFNYTSLPLSKASGAVYFFQNRKAGAPKVFPYISQFPPQFDTGKKYSAGDIISDGAEPPTKMFVASRIQSLAPPSAGWIEDPLVNGTALHYATAKDLLPLYTDLLRFNTGESGLNLSIEVKDRRGNIFHPPFETVGEDNKSVLLADIHLLPEDFFTIKLQDPAKPYAKEFSFYRLAQKADADAILDLTIKSDDPAFNMTTATGILNSPVYQLRFRNRILPWLYNGKQFTSKPKTPPLPLTKFGTVAVTLKNDANEDTDLPNPDVRMIKVNKPAADKPEYDLFTETFIH